ncbi:hypothetical protein OSCI_2990021 [Kamptonema sp. PCC 6506]|nr:hypothetical protein OSCI_2990021 [Kamptonema sp. PCC 6506]
MRLRAIATFRCKFSGSPLLTSLSKINTAAPVTKNAAKLNNNKLRCFSRTRMIELTGFGIRELEELAFSCLGAGVGFPGVGVEVGFDCPGEGS